MLNHLLYRKPLILFKGYRDLTAPKATWKHPTAYCPYDVALVKWSLSPNAVLTADELSARFNDTINRWETTRIYREFNSLFQSLPLPKITKIVCFSLGTLYCNLDPDDLGSMMQHACALSMARWIQNRFDTQVRVLVQDPAYNEIDRIVLAEKGIETVGEYGAAGFADVDESSLVMTIAPSVCVREILADFVRPAAIICTPLTFDSEPSVYDQDYLDRNIVAPDGKIYMARLD